MSVKKILIFDLDGTLTDSAEGIYNSFRYALKACGRAAPTDNELRQCIGPPLWDSFSRVFGFPDEEIAEVIRQYRVYYKKTGIFENRLYDGIPEMLKRLQDGGYTLAVASSKVDESVKKVIDHFDLTKYFTLILGSSDVVKESAKADLIKTVLTTLGAWNTGLSAAMIGDRKYDMEGAIAVKIRAVGAGYGYGTEEELLSAGAEYVAGSPREVAEYFLKAR